MDAATERIDAADVRPKRRQRGSTERGGYERGELYDAQVRQIAS
jgi:hypothetical protein